MSVSCGYKLKVTMKIILIILLYLSNVNANNPQDKEDAKSNTPLSYYMRQLERYRDLSGDYAVSPLKNDLVSVVVRNFRDIFDEYLQEINNVSSSTLSLPSTLVTKTCNPVTRTIEFKETEINNEDPKLTDLGEKLLYRGSLSNSTITSNNDEETVAESEIRNQQVKVFSKYLKSKEKSDQTSAEVDNELPTSVPANIVRNSSDYITIIVESKRSCIFCDNIVTDNCHDPRKKLLPSVVCDREGDVCYSQHTPFGIIDRGCFNINHNLTTFVCNCNLCNYISLSEMPFIFSDKQEWVNNVVELSRTRNFRRTVFKDMACLQCEVNSTKRQGDDLNNANCLEGNIEALPRQVCAEFEVCAVVALKSDGYIWRGCVKAPLYNYWFALCDSDLCNYDPLVSIHDFI